MNTLEIFIALNELDHAATLDRLMEAGMISDNVVTTRDVAEPDATQARDWLANEQE